MQFVRLFHILSLDGLMMSKVKLVFDVISECGHMITRDHLRAFIAMISECEDEDIDYAVGQVFSEIAPVGKGITFAMFRDLILLTDSFVSSVCIPLHFHHSSHHATHLKFQSGGGEKESPGENDEAANQGALGDNKSATEGTVVGAQMVTV